MPARQDRLHGRVGARVAEGLVIRYQALARRISKPNATWVRPELLAEIEYRGLTDEGLLRHASFKSIREDLRE